MDHRGSLPIDSFGAEKMSVPPDDPCRAAIPVIRSSSGVLLGLPALLL